MLVCVIIYGTVGADAEMLCGLNGINIGSDEKELPAILFLLAFDHLFDFIARILVTGVFKSICSDDKHSVFRDIFGTSILVDVSNMLNCSADSINECSASSNIILFVSHRFNVGEFDSVVNDLVHIVKEHGGNITVAVLLPLLLNQRIESANGVTLKPSH